MDDCATHSNVAPILGNSVPPYAENEYITREQAIGYGAEAEPLAKYKNDNELVLLKDIVKRNEAGQLSTTGRVGISFMNGFDFEIDSASINITAWALNPNDQTLIDQIYMSGDLERDPEQATIFNGENIFAESRKEVLQNNLIAITSIVFIGNRNDGAQVIYDLFINQMAIGRITPDNFSEIIEMTNYSGFTSQLFDRPITYLASYEQLHNFVYSIRIGAYNTTLI